MTGMQALLFAYPNEDLPWELTRYRTASCVPFGGRYRVIDFLLSSLKSAQVFDVGILLHGADKSLIGHLGSGKVWDMSRKRGGMTLLPVTPRTNGWMEMLSEIEEYVRAIRRDHILLAAADLVANLPLADILQAHLASGADITAVCTSRSDLRVDTAQSAYFRVENGALTKVFFTKNEKTDATDLGVYLLSKTLLMKLLENCRAYGETDFYEGVLCNAQGLSIRPYYFDGFVARIHSMRDYYRCSMALLNASVRRDLFCASRPICAREEDEGASYFSPDSHCRRSLVADGCHIEGQVEDSILFPGVTVGVGAEVRNCILMKNTHVGDGVILSYIVSDKNVTFEEGRTLIGHENYPIAVEKGSTV